MPQPLHLDLVKEIHPTKNLDVDLSKLHAFTHKNIWWLCSKCGHEWQAYVNNRSRGTQNCGRCSGKALLIGENDLATTHPQLAAEWHPTKNGTLTPKNIKSGSNKKVWWYREECTHEWDATINSRAENGRGCPVCANKRVLIGENDLATTHPQLAAEWHPTKNGTLTPKKVVAGSGRKVWWQCTSCDHEWEATLVNRSKEHNPTGCPICTGHVVHSGVNDLAALYPEIAAQWHPIKNGELTPSMVFAHTQVEVWWQCESCNHEWTATVAARTAVNKAGCGVCSNSLLRAGVNDLATLYPEIAAQWHPTKNGELTPSQVKPSSNKKVWWQCEKGHEWDAFIYARLYAGCRRCTAGSHASEGEKQILTYIESLGLTIDHANRNLIAPFELDIYIPSKNIAVEYNGLYWHSDAKNVDKLRHHQKYEAAAAAGIQLLQIWEDDWQKKPEMVKTLLAHKLGLSSQKRVPARKTQLAEITKNEASTFMLNQHIQGFVAGSVYLGLYSQNEIVAVMILRREIGSKNLVIARYATSHIVIGGFTKLLAFATKEYKPAGFVTFSDHMISDGKLYANNGFYSVKELPPDYMYLVDGARKHKFGYRLSRFRNDDNLIYLEGLSESELAAYNGLPRIWDAGKTKWFLPTP